MRIADVLKIFIPELQSHRRLFKVPADKRRNYYANYSADIFEISFAVPPHRYIVGLVRADRIASPPQDDEFFLGNETGYLILNYFKSSDNSGKSSPTDTASLSPVLHTETGDYCLALLQAR